MPLRFLSDTRVEGELNYQESGFTTITATSSGYQHTVDMNSNTNNFTLTFRNGTNNISFSNLGGNVGKAGNVICNNPSSVGSFTGASVDSSAYTPGGSFISWDTTASGIAVISYLVLSSTKVLINYVGNFDAYPSP